MNEFYFFNYAATTESLRPVLCLRLWSRNTSDGKPLVVHYPLTDNTSTSFFLVHISYARTECLSHFLFLAPDLIVVVKVRLLGTPAEICLPPHDWSLVHAPDWRATMAFALDDILELAGTITSLHDNY